MTRRALFSTSALALSAQQPASRPNIVVILADDLGLGDLGCQGAPDIRTPHIDALAAGGMRFDNFYANCTVCSPTRASLMTGCYPDRVGVPGVIRTMPDDSFGRLSPQAVTLPAALKKSGYHTAIVGKWHLGLQAPDTPNDRGFDHFHGFLGDMMDDYFNHRRHGRNYLRLNRQEIDPPGHATDLFTQWACDYVDGRKRQPNVPFFLYLAYNAPHVPLHPAPEWLKKAEGRGLTGKRAQLAALIEHMDDGIGQLMKRLPENTLVIFSSDNGGDLPAAATCGPWRSGKGDFYEGGIRVACFASWKGHIAAGSRSGVRALTMDLFATACDAAGAALPAGVDGVSLMPVLRGGAASLPERDLFWTRREGGAKYQGRDYFAMRRGDWKLVQGTPFEPYQLFHLGEDPKEERNRAASEPALVRQMAAAIARHAQRAGRTAWQ